MRVGASIFTYTTAYTQRIYLSVQHETAQKKIMMGAADDGLDNINNALAGVLYMYMC